jgi:hypothetical protein
MILTTKSAIAIPLAFLALMAPPLLATDPCPRAKLDDGNVVAFHGNQAYVDNAPVQGNCNLIITFNADGSITTNLANLSSYDGVDDQLIGVINNTNHPITSFVLSNPGVGIFHLDIEADTGVADGICSFVPFTLNPAPCDGQAVGLPTTTLPGSYLGGAANFLGISPGFDSGTVTFLGIPSGGTSFFSLETRASLALQINGGGGGQPNTDIPFQVRYASNLNFGDAVVNIMNTGANNGANICANVYTFSPDEQLISCCSCVVTPNALVSLSARNDLISNTLTPAVPTSIVIKVLASAQSGSCNAATPGAQVNGLAAWGTTLHVIAPVGNAVTETRFTPANLSASELARITSFCGFIQANGSGFGICSSCRLGGLGADKQ